MSYDDTTEDTTRTDEVSAAVEAALAKARADQEAALAKARADQEAYVQQVVAAAIKAERERAAASIPTVSGPAPVWTPETIAMHDDWRKRQETVKIDGTEHAIAARAEVSPNLHYGIIVDNGAVKAVRLPENGAVAGTVAA